MSESSHSTRRAERLLSAEQKTERACSVLEVDRRRVWRWQRRRGPRPDNADHGPSGSSIGPQHALRLEGELLVLDVPPTGSLTDRTDWLGVRFGPP